MCSLCYLSEPNGKHILMNSDVIYISGERLYVTSGLIQVILTVYDPVGIAHYTVVTQKAMLHGMDWRIRLLALILLVYRLWSWCYTSCEHRCYSTDSEQANIASFDHDGITSFGPNMIPALIKQMEQLWSWLYANIGRVLYQMWIWWYASFDHDCFPALVMVLSLVFGIMLWICCCTAGLIQVVYPVLIRKEY